MPLQNVLQSRLGLKPFAILICYPKTKTLAGEETLERSAPAINKSKKAGWSTKVNIGIDHGKDCPISHNGKIVSNSNHLRYVRGRMEIVALTVNAESKLTDPVWRDGGVQPRDIVIATQFTLTEE